MRDQPKKVQPVRSTPPRPLQGKIRHCPKCHTKQSAKWSHPFCWACKADLELPV